MSTAIEDVIKDVERMCIGFLTPDQVRQVSGVMCVVLRDCVITKEETALSTEFAITNDEYVRRFLLLKTVKGCTDSTVKYYETVLRTFFMNISKPVPSIQTNDIRAYLTIRERRDCVSKCCLNNELRVLGSFFNTMLVEEYIRRDPTVRIEKIKSPKKMKNAFSEIELERIRAACENKREIAIVEVLYSTGCRVSELVGIDLDEIDGDQVIVHGKGQKDRICYLNAKAQIAIKAYIATRTDKCPALFVGELKPLRLGIGTIEKTVRELGRRAGVDDVHPHRFRRTAATLALRRGMPIDQVSMMLGHEQLTTTQIYAKTDEHELKRSHEKYMI